MVKRIISVLLYFYFISLSTQLHGIIKDSTKVIYDFRFAELSVKYIETGDSKYLDTLAELDATQHIFNHAIKYNSSIPKSSKIELVTYLLSPLEEKRKIISDFKKNLVYAKENIAKLDLAQKVCLEYLPKDFNYSSTLFFTFGYDLGVVYGNNASVNLAHPHYIKNTREIEYYSIHELHHAGFVKLKNNIMPSLNITTYGDMSKLIEYFTHLEGMGTYAPLDIRIRENAMSIDIDYILLRDDEQMEVLEKEFFAIYFHFKNNPKRIISDADWEMVSILSDSKRLWYRVGAIMAQKIDRTLGRERLVNLISNPSEEFFKTYLYLKPCF